MTESDISNTESVGSNVKEIKKNNDTAKALEKSNNITNESNVTVRSRSSSSLADKSTYYSDDAESHQSLDTIATEKSRENTQDNNSEDDDVSDLKSNGHRKRALTVTQQSLSNNITDEEQQQTEKEFKTEGVLHASGESASKCETKDITKDITNDMADIHDQIHGLQDDDDYSDSDSYTENLSGTHRRHQSHRSTMSSIHSFVSSASNYDLLLARLGSKDSINTLPETQANEIKTSFERVYNEAVTNGDEEEIDWEFWSKVISDFNGVAKSQPKVLSYHIQRGIPPSLRGMIWQLFAKSKNVKLEEQYMQLIKEDSVYEKAIARDLPKIFIDNEYFQGSEGQEAFFNVMKAYSLYDKELGYSQGICYIVGPLLLNMPEEEAFCVLVQLMNKYSLRGHFLPQTDLIAQRLYQLEGLVTDHLPHIQRHFEAQGIRANVYAHQWFSTLFVYRFPLDTVFRIYDMIFAEGVETLLRFSLALLEKNQSTILSLEFDDLIDFLKNDLVDIYQNNSNQLVQDAFKIHIVTKRLDRLAKDYHIEAARATSEAEAIETLKKQNKILADSIKSMETNYSELNKEHTDIASELIHAKMNIARISDENEVLRQQSNDLKKALETLPGEVEARVKEEMEILYTKNAALVERNSALEDQLAYMENMIIDIKAKYSESEEEREGLRQRLTDLKHLMG